MKQSVITTDLVFGILKKTLDADDMRDVKSVIASLIEVSDDINELLSHIMKHHPSDEARYADARDIAFKLGKWAVSQRLSKQQRVTRFDLLRQAMALSAYTPDVGYTGRARMVAKRKTEGGWEVLRWGDERADTWSLEDEFEVGSGAHLWFVREDFHSEAVANVIIRQRPDSEISTYEIQSADWGLEGGCDKTVLASLYVEDIQFLRESVRVLVNENHQVPPSSPEIMFDARRTGQVEDLAEHLREIGFKKAGL